MGSHIFMQRSINSSTIRASLSRIYRELLVNQLGAQQTWSKPNMVQYSSGESTYTEADCCGNDCVHCVLYMKPPKKTTDNSGKLNVIQNYAKFSLINKVKHSETLPHILELHFRHDEGESKTSHFQKLMLDVPAGHHLMMRVPNLAGTEENPHILRPYSPYWVEADYLEFKILVNLSPQGPMSKYIENLQPHDIVEFRGPVGVFTHEPATKDDTQTVIIITQGVGIASAMRVIEQILDNEDDLSRVVHLACFTDLEHFYFRDRLRNFARYWNYKSKIYLAHEKCDIAKCRETGQCSLDCERFQKQLRYKELIFPERLGKVQLEDTVRELKANSKVQVVISGSRGFQDFMMKSVKELEVRIEDSNIHAL